MAAHITYLSDSALHRRFGRNLQDRQARTLSFDADFQVESYLPGQARAHPGELCRVAHDQPGLEAIGGILVRPVGYPLHQALQAKGCESINVLRDCRQRGTSVLTQRVIVVPSNAQVRKSAN